MLKLLKPAPSAPGTAAGTGKGSPTVRGEAAATRTRPARPPAVAPVAAPAAGIALLQSHSLPALVQRELERMILAGDLPPGTKLNEAALADLLGVSRGPVREAFRALEESGLVRLEKNRGVYVRQIAVEEADNIYELRAVLDAFVGRRVAASADPDAVRELRSHVARMEKAATRNDVDGYLKANLEFHDRLVELAGNAKLLTTYRRLVNELRLFRRTTLAQNGVLPTSAREHRQIVDRIAAADGEGAAHALHEHVMASRERMHKANATAVRDTATRKGR
ncbi:MAG: phosphonate utilization associated transcriptional regulator [Betaproteobacteria bacterium]